MEWRGQASCHSFRGSRSVSLQQGADVVGVASDDSFLSEARYEVRALTPHGIAPLGGVAGKVVDSSGDLFHCSRRDANPHAETIEVAIDPRSSRVKHRHTSEKRFEINHPKRLIHARQQEGHIFGQLANNLRVRSDAAKSDAIGAAGHSRKLPYFTVDPFIAPPEHVQSHVGVLLRSKRQCGDEPMETLLAIHVEVENRHKPGCGGHAHPVFGMGGGHQIWQRSDLLFDADPMSLSSGISPADKPSIAAIPNASYSDALANTEHPDIAWRICSSFGRTMRSTAWPMPACSASLRMSAADSSASDPAITSSQAGSRWRRAAMNAISRSSLLLDENRLTAMILLDGTWAPAARNFSTLTPLFHHTAPFDLTRWNNS